MTSGPVPDRRAGPARGLFSTWLICLHSGKAALQTPIVLHHSLVPTKIPEAKNVFMHALCRHQDSGLLEASGIVYKRQRQGKLMSWKCV